MTKKIRTFTSTLGAAITMGMLASQTASATTANNFSKISENIGTSIEGAPGLVSAIAYLVGLLLAVLGCMKIRDHIDNPANTPLKEGMSRLIIGASLFALPFILDVLATTIDAGATDVGAVGPASLAKAKFTVGD